MHKPTDSEADYRCLSPLGRNPSELEGEEEYTCIFRTLLFPRNLRNPHKIKPFPQIRVARTTIKLVSSSIFSRRFEYLAGKCYVASDWPKTVKNVLFFTVFKYDKRKKVLFFTVSKLLKKQLFPLFFRVKKPFQKTFYLQVKHITCQKF
jgi:hypothetical protein